MKIKTNLLLSAFIILGLTGCTSNKPTIEVEETTISEITDITTMDINTTQLIDTDYGFKIQVPDKWADRYYAENNGIDGGVSLTVKCIIDSENEVGYSGWLGTIAKATDEVLSREDFEKRSEEFTGGLGYRYLGTNTQGTYIIRYPSEIQCPPEDKNQVNEYASLFGDMNKITLVNGDGDVISVEPSKEDIEYINLTVEMINNVE